jgi:hypothetical protein
VRRREVKIPDLPRQSIIRFFGDETSPTGIDYKTDDSPDHLAEKTVRLDFYYKLGTMACQVYIRDVAERAFAIFLVPNRKPSEIALFFEILDGRRHPIEVEAVFYEPKIPSAHGRWLVNDPVIVHFAPRGKTAVKILIDFGYCPDMNIIRGQGVQSVSDFFRSHPAVGKKIRDLSERMDTLVGPARARDPGWRAEHFGQSPFDLALNRAAVGLELPARIIGSVILDVDLKIPPGLLQTGGKMMRKMVPLPILL